MGIGSRPKVFASKAFEISPALTDFTLMRAVIEAREREENEALK
jgi:hypothetical protein